MTSVPTTTPVVIFVWWWEGWGVCWVVGVGTAGTETTVPLEEVLTGSATGRLDGLNRVGKWAAGAGLTRTLLEELAWDMLEVAGCAAGLLCDEEVGHDQTALLL